MNNLKLKLSIIVCSREAEIDKIFEDNIFDSIGCAFELIIIDNSRNQYSIFEAYNIGIERSNGDYWCFMHDDILFHAKDWGIEVLRIFEQDRKIGLIGIAGAKVKTKMPSAWWDCPEQFKIMNIIQHFKSGKVKYLNQGWREKNIEEVVVIDGVFMAARRLDKIRFSDSLEGFHNYDLNLSFEYIKHNYKIVVTNKVLLEHFSKGEINSSWYRSTLKIHDLYSKILPLFADINMEDNSKLEIKNGSKFFSLSFGHITRISIIKLWIRLIKLKPISKFHLKFLRILFSK
jgi:hypothetical protein